MDWSSRPYWLKFGIIYVLPELFLFLLVFANLRFLVIFINSVSLLSHVLYPSAIGLLLDSPYRQRLWLPLIIIIGILLSLFISFICKNKESFKQNIILSILAAIVFSSLANLLITFTLDGEDLNYIGTIYLIIIPISLISLIFIIFKVIKIRKS